MHYLFIDIETYSDFDIGSTGSWRYFESPAFEILLIAHSMDGEPVQVVDLAQGEALPEWFIPALTSPDVIKYAFNAAFEYGAFCRTYGQMVPEQWRDTMFHGMYASLPASLKAMGEALQLGEDKRKLTTGAALIRYFCQPCKPTKANGYRTRNYPHQDPDKWALFKEYNRQDVEAEMEIERRLSDVHVPPQLQKQWETDLRINQRGVHVDTALAWGALAIRDRAEEMLMEEAAEITGLENPNSMTQLRRWVNSQVQQDVEDMSKATVASLLKEEDLPDHVRRVLEIRQELGKTSTKKYDAVRDCTCDDSRVRGLLQFYGASRTGRWAGRLLQLQNLPRTYLKMQDLARELVRDERMDVLQLIFGQPFDTLAQLVRTVLTATPNKKLVDADFSAIEARVISWLAGEEWALHVFRNNGKIYEATAAQMFGVPVNLIKKGNPEYALRAKGKVATLALGYQGGASALIAMGALEQGLTEEELPEIVDKWRKANPHIKALWDDFNRMAIEAVESCQVGTHYIGAGEALVRIYRMRFDSMGMSALVMDLPSGRKLVYLDPALGINRFGGVSISYLGVNQTTKKWERVETYGGRLVENCLAEGTLVYTDSGLKPIETIDVNDLIWDGDEFVSHEGLIDQGSKSVIRVDGLLMTPDHRILTEEGWMRCSEAAGHCWSEVRKPGGTESRGNPERKVNVPFKKRLAGGITVREAGFSKRVYDIRNCGPRHRFVVDDGGAPRIVSNCVQAIARDLLAEAIERLEAAGYPVVFHVHDEVVIDISPYADDKTMLADVVRIMSQNPSWCPSLPLAADGWVGDYFTKD